MNTRTAKNKGKGFQNDIREYLIEHLNIDPEDIISNPMGNQGEDLILSRAGREIFPFSVECKRIEKASIYSIIKQVTTNCKNNHPLIVMRKNRMEPWCITRLSIITNMLTNKDLILNNDFSLLQFKESNICFDSIEVGDKLNIYKSIDRINKKIKNIKSKDINGSVIFTKKEGDEHWIGIPFYEFIKLIKKQNNCF